jgi:hypothetical protein
MLRESHYSNVFRTKIWSPFLMHFTNIIKSRWNCTVLLSTGPTWWKASCCTVRRDTDRAPSGQDNGRALCSIRLPKSTNPNRHSRALCSPVRTTSCLQPKESQSGCITFCARVKNAIKNSALKKTKTIKSKCDEQESEKHFYGKRNSFIVTSCQTVPTSLLQVAKLYPLFLFVRATMSIFVMHFHFHAVTTGRITLTWIIYKDPVRTAQ